MIRNFANIAFLFLSIIVNDRIQGQDSSRNIGPLGPYKTWVKTELVTGINWQGAIEDDANMLRYFEIGLARSVHADGRHGPVSLGIIASEEFQLGDSIQVYGTKLGIYAHWIYDLGFSIVYYTDFKQGNLKLRPEFGFGMGPLRLVMGFNIPTIKNKSFALLRKNLGQITIQCLIPLKKKEVVRDANAFSILLNRRK